MVGERAGMGRNECGGNELIHALRTAKSAGRARIAPRSSITSGADRETAVYRGGCKL